MAKRKKKKKSGGNPVGKLLIVLSCIILILCAASITSGFFIRFSSGDDDPGRRLRIEILNGTGRNGLAQEAATALMEKGIDVFKTGNADHFSYEQSILISRKKCPQFEQLGKILGCDRTVEQLQEGSLVDATLILGADFNELKLGLSKNLYLPE
jgi:hypothetical protein